MKSCSHNLSAASACDCDIDRVTSLTVEKGTAGGDGVQNLKRSKVSYGQIPDSDWGLGSSGIDMGCGVK